MVETSILLAANLRLVLAVAIMVELEQLLLIMAILLSTVDTMVLALEAKAVVLRLMAELSLQITGLMVLLLDATPMALALTLPSMAELSPLQLTPSARLLVVQLVVQQGK